MPLVVFQWLQAYTTNKLQPSFSPCIFIGYSPSQYAYQYFDPITHKTYTSRYVKFYDNIYPYTSLSNLISTIIPTSLTIPLEPHIIQPLHLKPSHNPTSPPTHEHIPPLNLFSTVPTNSVHKASLNSQTPSNNNHTSSTCLSIPTSQNVADTTDHHMQAR